MFCFCKLCACSDYALFAPRRANSVSFPTFLPLLLTIYFSAHRYNADGSHSKVDFPQEEALVFDVETCVAEGQFPTLAAAVSPSAWYSWCSQHLCRASGASAKELIRISDSRRRNDPRIIVGHMVSYDRQRLLDEYALAPNGINFLDTMSLHMTTSGLSSQQRGEWMRHQKEEPSSVIPEAEVGGKKLRNCRC